MSWRFKFNEYFMFIGGFLHPVYKFWMCRPSCWHKRFRWQVVQVIGKLLHMGSSTIYYTWCHLGFTFVERQVPQNWYYGNGRAQKNGPLISTHVNTLVHSLFFSISCTYFDTWDVQMQGSILIIILILLGSENLPCYASSLWIHQIF